MGDKAINLNQQLNEIESLFSTGHIKKAQKDLRKLNSQFGKGKPIPSKFRHKFQRLNFTAKEYDDWAEFATSDDIFLKAYGQDFNPNEIEEFEVLVEFVEKIWQKVTNKLKSNQ